MQYTPVYYQSILKHQMGGSKTSVIITWLDTDKSPAKVQVYTPHLQRNGNIILQELSMGTMTMIP